MYFNNKISLYLLSVYDNDKKKQMQPPASTTLWYIKCFWEQNVHNLRGELLGTTDCFQLWEKMDSNLSQITFSILKK